MKTKTRSRIDDKLAEFLAFMWKQANEDETFLVGDLGFISFKFNTALTKMLFERYPILMKC